MTRTKRKRVTQWWRRSIVCPKSGHIAVRVSFRLNSVVANTPPGSRSYFQSGSSESTMNDDTVKRVTRNGGCRLCLAPDTECVPIFATAAADKEPLSNKIFSCVNIKVNWRCHAIGVWMLFFFLVCSWPSIFLVSPRLRLGFFSSVLGISIASVEWSSGHFHFRRLFSSLIGFPVRFSSHPLNFPLIR